MKHKDWLVSIMAGLIIGLLFSITGITNSFNSVQSSNAISSSANAVAQMRSSDTKWSSLSAEGTTIWYTDKGTENVKMSVQINQPNKVKLQILQTDENGDLVFDYVWVTDGDKIYEQNNIKKTYTLYDVPAFARLSHADLVLTTPKEDTPSITRHPIAMLMPSPLADYIYPIGLSQRTGTYSLEANNQTLGRPVFVLDFMGDNASEHQKLEVDQSTGIIIKAQTFGEKDKLFEETTLTNILVDAENPIETFSTQPPDGFTYVPLEEFSRR